MRGYDVFFLTGTDEHGQKIERKAASKGVTPKAYVDEIVTNIKELWKLMDVAYDDFIRTTDDRHAITVQKIFRQLYDQGDIYKSEYEGWYCTPCESFWTELQLKDGMCPDCGRPVEKMREESYFLKLSKYQNWLIQYIKENPGFIQPTSRANEMLKNFLEPGLEDLCVSRTSLKWGIPVDFDTKHTVYVWLDALSNYISALGYGTEHDELFQKYWPADVHVVGKEIIRFHTIIWPIVLHALSLPLPKQIFGHGWLVMDGKKMGKSFGNVIDPVVLCHRFGTDAIRYYLLREMPFGSDGQFNYEGMLTRINADLANDLGNLVSRTVAMIEKYFDGVVPQCGELMDVDKHLITLAEALPEKVETQMEKMQFSIALAEIWKLIGECNKYIDITQPWVLGKDSEGAARLKTVLYVLAECVRFVAVLVGFAMPSTPKRIFEQLGITEEGIMHWGSLLAFGQLPKGTKVKKSEALFPRIDIAKELKTNIENEMLVIGEKNAAKGPQKENEEKNEASFISINEFDKIQLRVARVTACEKVEKSDKLLKLSLSLGAETRTVVSGIAQSYSAEEMVGKQVVLLANLKPVKLRGILSEGMILCAADKSDTLMKLVTVEEGMEDGALIG